jgi:hypothetical protein
VISQYPLAQCLDEGTRLAILHPARQSVDAMVGLAVEDGEIDAWEWDLAESI